MRTAAMRDIDLAVPLLPVRIGRDEERIGACDERPGAAIEAVADLRGSRDGNK